MGSFMQPETTYGTWFRIERGGESFGPIEEADLGEEYGPREDRPETVEALGAGYCARLSAPGYLDCTDYVGPCATEAEALAELAELHDMCAHCFDEGCQPGEPGECYPAALDSLRGNVRNATSEALRGRIRETHNEWIARAIARNVRAIEEGADDADRLPGWRDDVRRACALGIEEGRRAILRELAELLRDVVAPIDERAGRMKAEAVRIRFPGLFRGPRGS